MAIIPGFVPRSVAGSYDNEAVAIFGLVLTFYLFLKALRAGSLLWSLAASLSYFYTAASWGGYIIVPNLLAVYFLCLLAAGSVAFASFLVRAPTITRFRASCAQSRRHAGLDRVQRDPRRGGAARHASPVHRLPGRLVLRGPASPGAAAPPRAQAEKSRAWPRLQQRARARP